MSHSISCKKGLTGNRAGRHLSCRRNFNNNSSQVSGRNFKLVQPDEIQVGFDEIWGHKECKKDLQLLIDYLQGTSHCKEFNVRPPFKYVLNGPNGNGRSTIVYAVAKTANLPIVDVEPSFFFNTTEVLEELEEIFDVVQSHLNNGQNCILLFKGIHHIAELTPEVGHPLTESLVKHFRDLPELVVFGTIEVTEDDINISPQLLEKPAFEKAIELPFPELKVREQIFTHLLKNIPTEDGLDIHRLGLDSYQMSTGAIKNWVREASMYCLRNKRTALSYEDFSEALAQMDFGCVSMTLNPEERLITARHEAGHVVAGYFSDPKNYKPSKVDITPRSIYLGVTCETPDEEKKSYFKEELENQIVMAYGGMASEEFYYQSTTAGVAKDIQQATAIAVNIHKLYGMNYTIGPICLLIENHKFPEIDKKVDECILQTLNDKYAEAQRIIREHSRALDALTQALLDKEVLYSDEIMAILKKYS